MRAIVVTSPETVEEQEVPDHLNHLVIPARTPAAITDGYPIVILSRYTLRHEDPRIAARVAFWPTSWADHWGIDAIQRAGMLP